MLEILGMAWFGLKVLAAVFAILGAFFVVAHILGFLFVMLCLVFEKAKAGKRVGKQV